MKKITIASASENYAKSLEGLFKKVNREVERAIRRGRFSAVIKIDSKSSDDSAIDFITGAYTDKGYCVARFHSTDEIVIKWGADNIF